MNTHLVILIFPINLPVNVNQLFYGKPFLMSGQFENFDMMQSILIKIPYMIEVLGRLDVLAMLKTLQMFKLSKTGVITLRNTKLYIQYIQLI